MKTTNFCGSLCAFLEYCLEKNLPPDVRSHFGWDSFTESFVSNVIKYGTNDIEWQTSICGKENEVLIQLMLYKVREALILPMFNSMLGSQEMLLFLDRCFTRPPTPRYWWLSDYNSNRMFVTMYSICVCKIWYDIE